MPFLVSLVWKYADKRKNPNTKETEAVCKRCGDLIKCSGGSTSSIRSHLKNKHGIDINSNHCADNEASLPVKKNKTILDYTEKQTLKEIVSCLAIDGISIRAITRNKYIRDSIHRDGFHLPANESDVMKLLHEDYEDKKNKMIIEIKGKIEQETKFSMSIDEYTTIRGRRYFGINLHEGGSNKIFKTGIVRIFESCPAELMVNIVDEHLMSFGVSMQKDVVGSCQDGAAVNKKFMRLINIIGQYCLNHGIHLAVTDTLYKKIKNSSIDPINDSNDAEELDCFDENIDFEILNNEQHDDDDDQIYFHDVLKNCREVVKYIKYSSVRNHLFQEKVVAEFKHEIELHLDVRHRWNSIPNMIDSLIKTKNCLFETFADLNKLEIINKLDFAALLSLQEAMEPIKLAVEVLSREDSTLVSADTVIEFMLQKLENVAGTIGTELYENLKKRINERMNKNVMDLIRCLKDSTNIPSRNTIIFAGELASRLFGVDDCQEININIESQEASTSASSSTSLKDELNHLLQKENLPATSQTKDRFKWLKQEFILYKNTGKRTENLQKIYNALLSIKPTSTDVERVFSTCTTFCSKLRSRLSDKSLNALVFLKFYYNKA